VRFTPQPLPPIPAGVVFDAPRVDFGFFSNLSFVLGDNPRVQALIKKGAEVRIFALAHDPGLSRVQDGAVRPGAWIRVGDCTVFLSLVIRPNPESLKGLKLNLGPLGMDTNWLAAIDEKSFEARYFLLVINERTAADEPSESDKPFGDNGAAYEFMRIESGKEGDYFNKALLFSVKPPDSAAPPTAALLAARAKAQKDFEAARDALTPKLHCYRPVLAKLEGPTTGRAEASLGCASAPSSPEGEGSGAPAR
jgi:hypothetical protein